ncbi:MAG: pilin [Ruminococcus sp.]|nr:pilin [Ruminococcus sp.]
MRHSFKKGFTLIELIVVIAIIGVLASILVPSVMGYVKKANRSTDLSTAKTIRQDSSIIIADGGPLGESFANTAGMSRTVTVIHAGKTETYTLQMVARKDANDNKPWVGYDSAADDFISALNNMEQNNVALKFRRLSNGGELESWFVCKRADEAGEIEVWVGDSGNNPLFRVFPETEDRYK